MVKKRFITYHISISSHKENKMKKLLVLLFALFTSFSVFAQNKQDAGIQGDLSDEQVIEKLTRNEILPLYVNSFLSFDNASNKEKIGKLAQQQVVKHRNYVAYYNAAVVYFVSDEFLGFDTSRYLSENDIANVVKYATKAIELSGKNPCPNMYLLRAEAKMKDHGLFGFFGPYMEEEPEVSWAKENKALAREILKDLEKVEKLNPKYAPYWKMAKLYEGIGDKANAKRCAEHPSVALNCYDAENLGGEEILRECKLQDSERQQAETTQKKVELYLKNIFKK